MDVVEVSRSGADRVFNPSYINYRAFKRTENSHMYLFCCNMIIMCIIVFMLLYYAKSVGKRYKIVILIPNTF